MSEAILPPGRRSKLEKFARTVVPELQDSPVYVVAASFEVRAGCQAFTPHGRLTSSLYEQVVADYDGWQGDGPVLVLCASGPLTQHYAVVAHELAHNTKASPPIDDGRPHLAAFKSKLLEINLRHTSARADDSPRWRPDHGLGFSRLGLHLHYRACCAGHDVFLSEVGIAGEMYDLSAAWKYFHAIGDEPRRMLGATLAEIAATPYPAEFARLFLADVSQPQHED